MIHYIDFNGQWWRTGGLMAASPFLMKYKHGTKEYWMDWYWNRGGREKVQAKRYIREYERERGRSVNSVKE